MAKEAKPFNGDPYMQRSGGDILQPDGTWFTPRAFLHPCAAPECDKEGAFGFKVNLTVAKMQPGTWYCFEHRHLGEALYQHSMEEPDQPPTRSQDGD